MKAPFFRWASALGSILGAALLVVAGMGFGSGTATAAGGRSLTVALWARTDVAADIVVRVLDPSAHDISATCGRGAVINPDADGWSCQSTDDLVLDITAAPGVVLDVRCTDALGEPVTSSNGQYPMPASRGSISCLVRATPPATYAPITPIALGYTAPTGQAVQLTLFDAQGNDRAECTSTNTSMECSPLPYGTYHFGVRTGSPDTGLLISCFLYTTTTGGGLLNNVESITFGPETLAVSCSGIAAAPYVSVEGTAQPVQLVDAQGIVTECKVFETINWACNVPATGGYHLELSEQAAQLPYACEPMFGQTTIDPRDFTITGDGIEWYTCLLTGGAPPTPTTIGGPTDSGAPSDTTGSGGPVPTTAAPRGLPATGGAAPLLPASLVLLGLGTAASLLARRPVR
ncbi:MAG: hypothetical protein ABMA25_11765 [Ilumatobacteraceae bacterium]